MGTGEKERGMKREALDELGWVGYDSTFVISRHRLPLFVDHRAVFWMAKRSLRLF